MQNLPIDDYNKIDCFYHKKTVNLRYIEHLQRVKLNTFPIVALILSFFIKRQYVFIMNGKHYGIVFMLL
jgi:hypothetical protein